MSEKTIELIVIDLDGTLLNNKHQLSERNEKALKAAIEQGVKVVIATGKTRHSARDVIAKLALTTPGIYLQGLAIYDGDGHVIHEQRLDPELARQVITFAEDRGFDMIAYSGSKILVRQVTQRATELTEQYGEPAPEAIGALQNVLGEMPINKLIAIRHGDARKIKALRWQLGKQLDGKGRLMQAMIPDMLEILPPNASKASALKVLLKQIGVNAENILAIGDGENDIEMLQMAGIGVAVGNAHQMLKDIADHVVGTNEEDGVAQALEQFVLKKPLETEAETAQEKAGESASSTANGEAGGA